jgi:PBP1b-binding outer membrane lipoprotein LpoB
MLKIFSSAVNFLLTSRLTTLARTSTCVIGALILIGCAHPISIEAKKVPEKEVQWSTKKVAYVISDVDKQKGFFINFTVIFLSLQDNPAFQNYRGQYEGHRVV